MPCDTLPSATVARPASRGRAPLELRFAGVEFQFLARADWPSEEEALACLSPSEAGMAKTLRHPERRRQWITGRYAAKCLAIDCGLVSGVAPAEMEIVSRDANGKGVPPAIHFNGRVVSARLSLSHTQCGVLAACASDRLSSIGVDLTDLSDCRPEALCRWFTEAELAAIDTGSLVDAATQWAVKEAVYKAACCDEPFAPRRVEAVRAGAEWRCRYYRKDLGRSCRIQVRRIEDLVAAVAVIRSA